MGFRVLAAGNFPQHRTLCEFRRRHLADFQALFVEVVRLAQELGLARLGKLSIDGTKVRANASKRKAMSYDRMQEEEQRLESEVEALLRQADEVDEAEDARLGAEVRGDDLPAELRRREARLAAIREAKARLEAAARAADDARGRQPGQDRNPQGGPPYKRAYGEPDEKAQSNFTDPESSIMKTSSEGFQQCYNAQVAVDAEHQLVVATEVTANASDQGELPVVLDAVKETFDAQPETVLADAGYCNERDLTDLEKRGVDGYVALGREGKQTGSRDPEKYPATNRMAEKLSKPEGRATYAERKWLSEAPHGWIKHVLGFRRFSLRWKWQLKKGPLRPREKGPPVGSVSTSTLLRHSETAHPAPPPGTRRPRPQSRAGGSGPVRRSEFGGAPGPWDVVDGRDARVQAGPQGP